MHTHAHNTLNTELAIGLKIHECNIEPTKIVPHDDATVIPFFHVRATCATVRLTL